MRVCDICGQPEVLYRLYEETNYNEERESGDLTYVGEFCRLCLDLVYGYVDRSRAQLMEDLENRSKKKKTENEYDGWFILPRDLEDVMRMREEAKKMTTVIKNMEQFKMPEVPKDINNELKAEMEKGFF